MSDFSLIEYENNYILNKPNYARYRPGFYPSSASVEYYDNGHRVVRGTCLRQGYYQAMNVESDPSSVYLNQTAFVGKTLEIAIVNRWKAMGIYVDNAIKFFDRDIILSGELDAIIKNPETNTLVGVEVKSFYGPKAERELTGVQRERGTNRAYYGQPKDYQFLQAVLYAWEYRDVLPEYRLYYFDRGNGTRYEFEVGVNRDDKTKPCWWRQIPGASWNMFQPKPVIQPYSAQDIHNRYIKLLEYARKKEVPPKDYNYHMLPEEIEYGYSIGEVAVGKYEKWQKKPEKNPIIDWHCSYCSFRSTCEQE